MSKSIEKVYDLKRDFSVLALTGLEGAGCSFMAELMSLNKEEYIKSNRLRSPDTFTINKMVESVNNADHYKNKTNNNIVINQLVFHRKYSICYNYFKEYYQPYTIIKYSKVCWLYTLLFLREKAGTNESFTIDYLKDSLKLIFEDKFVSSKSCPKGDKDYCYYRPNLNSSEIEKLIDCFDYDGLIEEINENYCTNFKQARDENAINLAKIFFEENSSFSKWNRSVTGSITKTDYYRTCYFYHRFATVLRTFGDPLRSSNDLDGNTGLEHIFCIVDMINVLLKWKNEKKGGQRRYVIDSIRNSTELAFLKERYNAFYVIAVGCSDEERNNNIDRKLIGDKKDEVSLTEEQKAKIRLTRNAIRWITDIEADKKDHDNGFLAFPDTELCFADAEIHITNSNSIPRDDDYCFSSIEEQWMKYATLLLHPGLITPSPEERCMAVAYTARLNSSCVSRQVGAVITNKFHAIRTIGWNDVPYGQVACGLRDLRDHFKDEGEDYSIEEQMMYSEFERIGGKSRYDKKYFRDCVREDFESCIEKADLKGYPAPYCFRTLDNRYTGEVNQTQTRSLHAEENAMLQMVKYGGEPLKDGVIYVTDSPCELCSKKLYQIGVRRIIFIDIYPGIANENITRNGLKQPELIQYRGAYGSSYIKLFRPVFSHKDELSIRVGGNALSPSKDLLKEILKRLGKKVQKHYSDDDVKDILLEIPNKKGE